MSEQVMFRGQFETEEEKITREIIALSPVSQQVNYLLNGQAFSFIRNPLISIRNDILADIKNKKKPS